MITPFDLHVLGTPPAFILSQDQTLMFKFEPVRQTLAKKVLALLSLLFLWLYLFPDTVRDVSCDTSNENLFGIRGYHLKCMWHFSFLEFSGLFHCSIIKVHCAVMLLFTAFLNISLTILSRISFLVNHFFYLFFVEFFIDKNLKKAKRRKRDLNPRAAINDLLPFQGSPFSRLGTSP